MATLQALESKISELTETQLIEGVAIIYKNIKENISKPEVKLVYDKLFDEIIERLEKSIYHITEETAYFAKYEELEDLLWLKIEAEAAKIA